MAEGTRIRNDSWVWSKGTGLCRTRHIADDVYEITRASGAAVFSEQALRDPTQFRLIEYPATPNLEKMRIARDTLHTQAIGEFLEWLYCEENLLVARYLDNRGTYQPIDETRERLIARYAEIDLDACNDEKEAVYRFQCDLNDLNDEIKEAAK
jgi:hypothetical protein